MHTRRATVKRRKSKVTHYQNFFGALLQRHAELGPALGSSVQSAHTHNHRPPFVAFLICAASLASTCRSAAESVSFRDLA
jgi:hypothetical protein